MKRLLCLSVAILSSAAGFSQVRFNSIFETGISLPVNKAGNPTHNSNGISIGNHIDLLFGSGMFSWGVGGYIGNINTNGVSDKFKETGMLIARRYQLQPTQLVFHSTSFQSTQFLLGPVAGISCSDLNVRVWAKGGFGIADPARYSVGYREGAAEQKIYVSNASDNKNGLSYDLGAGFYYLISDHLGIQLSASYNNTKTNQVNYSYEQEKGTLPSYQTVNNAFIKASIGLVLDLGRRQSKTGGRTYSGGRKNAREAGSGQATGRRQYQPLIIRILQVEDETPAGSVSSRDAGSGRATGRRQYQPLIIRIEETGKAEVVSPRDAASGQATGRRMHKPFIVHIDNGYDEPFEIAVAEEGAVKNPLYSESGNSGHNPLYQGKGIQEKGIKRSSEKGIQENGITSEKGINEAGAQKTVNTSRANIKRIQNINCQDDDCDVECVFELDGQEYIIILKGALKTRRPAEVPKSN